MRDIIRFGVIGLTKHDFFSVGACVSFYCGVTRFSCLTQYGVLFSLSLWQNFAITMSCTCSSFSAVVVVVVVVVVVPSSSRVNAILLCSLSNKHI